MKLGQVCPLEAASEAEQRGTDNMSGGGDTREEGGGRAGHAPIAIGSGGQQIPGNPFPPSTARTGTNNQPRPRLHGENVAADDGQGDH
jgi:hypothetical protein